MIYSYVKLRETFICFIFIAMPFHYIQLRVSLNAYAFNLTRRLRREIYCQRYCNKNTDTRDITNCHFSLCKNT